MAGFLVLVGLTGSLLAFLTEINQTLTPHLFPSSKPGTALKLGDLAVKAQTLLPRAEVKTVYVDSTGAAIISFEPRIDPATGKPYEFDFNQLFLDSGTGRELGRRSVGDLPTGLDNLMPFLYQLHYNLSLQRPGGIALGIVAVIWTVDCFVAFYLTLPARKKSTRSHQHARQSVRRFWRRWKTAWQIKRKGSAYRINFDLHRAGGLWLWFMLLVFAWSSVGFNLHREVYRPVMGLFFELPVEDNPAGRAPVSSRTPLSWLEAQSVAERLMREQARLHSFTIDEAIVLYRLIEPGRFRYQVRSSLDVREKRGATSVEFDLYSGRLLKVDLPSGQYSGTTITQWLFALHETNVFGLPYRIFVCFMGLAVVVLSVTGIIIWLRKRRSRAIHRSRALRVSGKVV